ncbi:hypothetical protein [Duncaniella dubosii]|uniref:hypothetical protein n=1 Tax=Duncaniella dubosii TaxID=2518971 RepID=UPI003F667513
MKFSDRLSLFGSQAASSAKSLIKVALQSHGAHISKAKSAADGKALIIMGKDRRLQTLSPDTDESCRRLSRWR